MIRNFKLSLCIALGLLGGSPSVFAYVTYHHLGYVSCGACHFTSTGGGLLKPYGHSVEAAMAAFPREIMPEERVYDAGLQARLIVMDSTSRANPFLMQTDLMGSVLVLNKVRAEVTTGLALRQGELGEVASVPSGWDGFVLRRALLSMDINEDSSVAVGRDAPVSGLNLDDHTAFLRSQNRRGIYDYPTQVRYTYQLDDLQLMPYLLFPSFEESGNNKEYGLGARAEYLLNETNAFGFTGLFANSPSTTRYALSAFFRFNQADWNGVASEFVFTHFDSHSLDEGFNRESFYIKPFVSIPEWCETGIVYEYLHTDSPFMQNGFQFGPEVNVRLHEWVSILGSGRNIGLLGDSTWSWYGQLFVHFQI